MREKDELDLLLDSALSSYADRHAVSGLEGRIMERLSAAGELRLEVKSSPRRRWLLWVIASPVAACLLFLMFTIERATQPEHPQQKSEKTEHRQANRKVESGPASTRLRGPSHQTKAPAIAASHSVVSVLSKSAPHPKLDVFPAPQPLTPEEQALYAFATQVPEKQRQAILNAQKNLNAPLDVAAIRIPPLEMSDESKN